MIYFGSEQRKGQSSHLRLCINDGETLEVRNVTDDEIKRVTPLKK